MELSRLSLEEAVATTRYFKSNLENLLIRLHPTLHCPKLIVKIILHGPDGSGKRLLARAATKKLELNIFEERAADLFDENNVGTEKKIRAMFAKIPISAPCVIYLTSYELFCHLEQPDLDRVEHVIKESLEELSEQSKQPIIFIAATNDFHRVNKTPLSEIFQYDIELKSPSQQDAIELAGSIQDQIGSGHDTNETLNYLSNGDYYLGNILYALAKKEVAAQYDPSNKENLKSSPQGTIESGIRWPDIGGLGDIKREIIDAIQLSLDYPQLKKSGLRRTGILLYGPPGTGKTLLAKAVATECDHSFINVKGPELLNEFVGQSEDNIRKLFQKARESSPSVIFFDEIDSLAPNRGQAGDSGGVMDRMVSQILAELDGVGKCDDVFVIGATNRVDLIDPSLMRPGRFDKVLEVPLPKTTEHRMQILQALTRKMDLADDVDLASVESLARPQMSGADFQGLCSRALQRSFDRCVELVESNKKTEDEVELSVAMEDFIASIEEMNGIVS